MEWFENTLQLREPWDMDEKEFLAMADAVHVQQEVDDEYGEEFLENYMSSPIMDAKYEKVSIDDVIAKQTQLSQKQKEDLRAILIKHTKLFDGTLGVYPHRKFNIELLENAKPVHSRPYNCLLYTSPSPRDQRGSRMPSSA